MAILFFFPYQKKNIHKKRAFNLYFSFLLFWFYFYSVYVFALLFFAHLLIHAHRERIVHTCYTVSWGKARDDAMAEGEVKKWKKRGNPTRLLSTPFPFLLDNNGYKWMLPFLHFSPQNKKKLGFDFPFFGIVMITYFLYAMLFIRKC